MVILFHFYPYTSVMWGRALRVVSVGERVNIKTTCTLILGVDGKASLGERQDPATEAGDCLVSSLRFEQIKTREDLPYSRRGQRLCPELQRSGKVYSTRNECT